MASFLLESFQSFRTILCVCPCCNQIHRLSDLRLQYSGKAPSTWLDDLDEKSLALDEKEAKFSEKEANLRAQAAERGRKKVDVILRKCMAKELACLKFNPYDIKTIMHPVDYVVFDGLNDGEMNKIVFLSKSSVSPPLLALRSQIRKSIESKSYDWKVARVDITGKISYE